MQSHTKKYFDYFKIAYNETGWHDVIMCEACGSKQAQDIHHLNGRWNKKNSNDIENLIALCRRCHEDAHNGILSKGDLHIAHFAKMNKGGKL